MKDFILNYNSTIKEALIKIDLNKRGFLLILDNKKLVGVLTDGDIRRSLLSGLTLSDLINFQASFLSLNVDDSFHKISELFNSEKIKFLPIIDECNKLINFITKKQFHFLLLHDQYFDLKEDFSNIPESDIDFDINSRPWGFYKSTLLSSYVQSKVITVFPNEELSLQEHKRREEHWVIIKGRGKVILGESIMEVYPGKYIYIPKGCKHQIMNNTKDNLIFSEVQLGDYFGEDDILRYSDKYGRLI